MNRAETLQRIIDLRASAAKQQAELEPKLRQLEAAKDAAWQAWVEAKDAFVVANDEYKQIPVKAEREVRHVVETQRRAEGGPDAGQFRKLIDKELATT